MSNENDEPIFPAQILLDEYILPLGYDISGFAREIGIHPSHLHMIIRGECPITSTTAIKLEEETGIKQSVWLDYQKRYSNWEAKNKGKRRDLGLIDNRPIKFPISRELALSKDYKFFWDDKPCKYGHNTYRYTSGGHCIECYRQKQEKKKQELKEKGFTKNQA